METITIPDVELMSVGMEWPSANGAITFTFEHLQDAMVAGNEDPHVVPARLKIGHTDPRFNDPDDPGHDPFYDGDPAFGSIENLRLVNDGATLIGDYVFVLPWLAEMLPTVYPSRSVEGAWKAIEGPLGEPIGTWEVETPGGKTYSFVLTAVALLGIQRPAVQDLEDLRYFLTEGGGVEVTGDASAEPVAASGGAGGDGSMGGVKRTPAEAAADMDKIIDVFCNEYAEGDRFWWWPRSLFIESGFVIADDDDGNLWSVAVTTDEDQNVTFEDEPTRVLQTFVKAPEPAAASASAGMVRVAASMAGVSEREKPVRVFASREESPARSRSEASEQGGQDGPGRNLGMDPKALAAALSELPADASQEDIAAVMAEHGAEITETPEGGDGENGEGTDGGEGTPAEGEGSEGGSPAPEAGAADDTTVTLDRGVVEKLQADAAEGVAARKLQRDNQRKADLAAAVRTGKIMPSSSEAWDRKYRGNPEATAAELEALPEGLVPVDEDGSALDDPAAGGAPSVDQAFMDQNFGNWNERGIVL